MLKAPKDTMEDRVLFPPCEVAELVLVLALRLPAAASRRQVRRAFGDQQPSSSTPRTTNSHCRVQHDRPRRHDTRRLGFFHAVLCVLPPTVAPLVTRAALIRIWWYTMDCASRDGRLDLLATFLKLNRCYGYALDYTPAALDLAAQNGHVAILEWWLNESGVPLGASLHAVELAMSKNQVHVLQWIKGRTANPLSRVKLTCKRDDPFRERHQILWSDSWHQPECLSFCYEWHDCVQAAVDSGALDALQWWHFHFHPPLDSTYQHVAGIRLSCTTPSVMNWWLDEYLIPETEFMRSIVVPLPVMLVQQWAAALNNNNLDLAEWMLRLPMFPESFHPLFHSPSHSDVSIWEPLRRVACKAVNENNWDIIGLLCAWEPLTIFFPPGSRVSLTCVSGNVGQLNRLISKVAALQPNDLISNLFVDQATARNHLAYLHWVDQHQPTFLATYTPGREPLTAAVFAGHLDTLTYWQVRPLGNTALKELALTGPALTAGTKSAAPISLAGLQWLASTTHSRITMTASILRTASGHGQLSVLAWCLTQKLDFGVTIPDGALVECLEWAITQGQVDVLSWWLAQCPSLFAQNAGSLLGVAFVANRPECLEWWFAHDELPFDGRGADLSASDGRDALQRNHLDVLEMWLETGDLARRAWMMVAPLKALRWCGGVRVMEWVVGALHEMGKLGTPVVPMTTQEEGQGEDAEAQRVHHQRAINEANVCACKCMLTGCMEYLRTRLGASRGELIVPDSSYIMWVMREQRLECPFYPCKCVQY